jgi:biotin carboxyl carrier protein
MVQNGQLVKKGDPLLTMESMKMETRLHSSHTGKVQLLVQEGQILEAGQRMVNIEVAN